MKDILTNLVKLTNVSAQDVATLQEAAPEIQGWGPEIVALFYNTLYDYGETAKVFKPGERPDREVTLSDWYTKLLTGKIDETFWQHQWFVGLIHIKREVRNHVMMSMMSRIQIFFFEKCLENFDVAKTHRLFTAFKRITDVIAGLIAEGYFENYITAMETVLGIKRNLVNNMLVMEVDRMIKKAKPA